MVHTSLSKAVSVVLLITFVIVILPAQSEGAGVGMDTSVTDSQASFIGEDLLDRAGQVVAGVGDVNGDGYDDFVISAPNHGDTPQRTGEVYLFFGNVTGWKMDMIVTDADASFYGQPGTSTGFHVDGPGDVNGDGYDDILILSLGRAYLFLGKAKGWSMDTQLWDSDASFKAEAGYFPGSAVGVGDVNRDGLDDFAISVYDNTGGGRNASIYLILGNRSGWSNNTALSDADASYWGEGENKGISLMVGAGDVNGDQYDDFLMWTSGYRIGDEEVGKVYLIFGKSSGWSMDVNLSSADTTFIGYSDHVIGRSVAGAGDVNDDGYDDILISRYGSSFGADSEGEIYLILGKATGWTKNLNLSLASPSFVGEQEGDYAGDKVAGVGDFNGDGFDDFLISARNSQEGGYFHGQVYLIYGRTTGWPSKMNLSNANASFLGEGDSDRLAWAIDGAGDVNGDGLGDILLGCGRNDEGGKDVGQSYLIFQTDGTPPTIENDRTPDVVTTGDNLTFNLSVTDPLAVVDVTVELWYGDSPIRDRGKCILSSGTKRNGTWLREVRVRSDTIDTLHYVVKVLDSDGIEVRSPVRDVTVLDDDPPVIFADHTPSKATTGDDLIFRVDLRDNVELGAVSVLYRFGPTAEYQEVNMSLSSGTRWTATITVPGNSLDQLQYLVQANDTFGNTNTTNVRVVPVEDNDKPVLEWDQTSGNATTGDQLQFKLMATDNIVVESTVVSYRYGNDDPINLTLHGIEDVWTGILMVEDTLEEIRYVVRIQDTSGNVRTTPGQLINVIDNDMPDIVYVQEPERVTTGDPFELVLTASDNIGIDFISVEYAILPGKLIPLMMQLEGIEWKATIDIPSDAIGRFSYRVLVEDWYGNLLIEPQKYLDILDNDRPRLIHDTVPTEAIKGLPVPLEYEASDNIGIDDLKLLYGFGEGPFTELQLDPTSRSVEVQTPRHQEDSLRYRIEATDAAGNIASTDEHRVDMVNAPPVVGNLPELNVLEDTMEDLDLVHYISDVNDVNFTIECTDDAVTIENTVIKILNEVVIPDRTILLTISDGEDEVTADLRVHVISVNDPPIIQSITPDNGSSYDAGKKLTFSVEAFDEEGDELTVTWKDGEKVLGKGSLLEVKLKPGEHVIAVIVDDGTDQVEESFTVIVKKEEDSPGFGLVVTLAAVVLAGLAVRRRP